MCSKATCRTCGKTTWAGCGRHVEQVMRKVPVEKRCTCGSKTAASDPVAVATAAPGRASGRLRSLFRR